MSFPVNRLIKYNKERFCLAYYYRKRNEVLKIYNYWRSTKVNVLFIDKIRFWSTIFRLELILETLLKIYHKLQWLYKCYIIVL